MTATQRLYDSETEDAVRLTAANTALAQAPPPAPASDFAYDFRRALHTWVGARIQKLLPALVVVYLAQSMLALVLRPVSAGILGWSAYVTAAASFLAWMLFRRKYIPASAVPFVTLLVAGSILFHSLAELYVASDRSQLGVIVLLVIGSASVLLSVPEFALIAALFSASWWIVAVQKLGPSDLAHGFLVLAATVSVSSFGFWLRLKWHAPILAERVAEENQTKERQEILNRFSLAVHGTQDGLWYWDLKSDIFYGSDSWEAMLGYQGGELERSPEEWFNRVHPGYLGDLRVKLAAHLEGQSEQFHNEHRLRRKNGDYLWVLARATAVRDESGQAVGLAGSHADITSVIDVEKRLLDDSFYDKLTRLPNRHYFMGRLQKAVEQRKRNPVQAVFAVMFLDLDRFKVINDSLGHLIGDQLLTAVAGRLRNCARPDDVIARFGGDEFVILLEGIRDPEEATHVAARIQSALSAPFQIDGREVLSGVSIGIVLSNKTSDSTEDLLRYADMAMYDAKNKGKGQAQVFNENMHVKAAKLCDMQTDLSRAIERRQLLLHYQPCVSLRTGKIFGMEALIRWQRSEDQLMQPMEFIPMAEETGLINDIGDWVLRSACAQNSAWQEAGMPPVRMAVNVSARQLQQKDFPEKVRRILEETRLQPKWLELELTETALMYNPGLAQRTLEELGALGIPIAIDDFGTGYSSLDYLRRFNFSTLKMDRCFVSDIVTDKKAAAVARGLISLAHNLNCSVTAEGVEHSTQLAFLAGEQCDQIQGFLACRPVPADHFTANRMSSAHIEKMLGHGGASSFLELHRLGDYAGEQKAELAAERRLPDPSVFEMALRN